MGKHRTLSPPSRNKIERPDGDSGRLLKTTSLGWDLSGLRRVAFLGDSAVSLLISSVVLALSAYYAYLANYTQPFEESLGSIPVFGLPVIYPWPWDEASELFAEVREKYAREGVVAVRGLVSQQLLEKLDSQSRYFIKSEHSKRGSQFHTVHHHTLFRSQAFAELALLSPVSMVAHQLLQVDANKTLYRGKKYTDSTDSDSTLRVIRDILLAKDSEQYTCGWHVDDMGFWPATPESPGINAWIALDDMPTQNGGGFALALGSHKAPWSRKAQYETGASTFFPPEGYQSAAHMFASRTGVGTCNIKSALPDIHKRMEDTKRIYEVKRGDVIFHTRWLFHRTIPFKKEFIQNEQPDDFHIYRRYSVRYGFGNTVVPPGYGVEPSVLWDDRNGGRTVDQVAKMDAPWYPQAWPHMDIHEIDSVFQLTEHKLPVAEALRDKRFKEMRPYQRELAGKQNRKPP